MSQVDFGTNSSQERTGCGGYRFRIGQWMKTERSVRMYRGGAAQAWQRLSGNGRSSSSGPFLRSSPSTPGY